MEIKSIKEKILRYVKLYYQEKFGKKQEFVPGKTKINYAGRVYDETELINLVDVSLDFWLTSGRYAEEFEKQLAKFLGIKYCLLINSGSSANLLAISALTFLRLEVRQPKLDDGAITTTNSLQSSSLLLNQFETKMNHRIIN